jgi:phage-related protein (TIGR01555 family)
MAKRRPKRKEKQDAYVNTLTGLGDWTQDKIFGGQQGPLTFVVGTVSNHEAEVRWRGSDLGARIVECVPSEMLREWFDLTIQPEEKAPLDAKAMLPGAGVPQKEKPKPFGQEKPKPEEGKPEEPTDPGEPVESPPGAPLEAVPGADRPSPFGEEPDEPKRDALQLVKPGFKPEEPESSGTSLFDPEGEPVEPETGAPQDPDEPEIEGEEGEDPAVRSAVSEQASASLETSELVEAFYAFFEKLELRQVLHTALCYKRAYGGAAIYLGLDDGQDPVQPLAEERIKEVTHLNVFSGGRDGECIARSYYADMKLAKYGKPEFYEIRNTGVMGRGTIPGVPMQKPAETNFLVHESRLLIFDGAPVSRRASQESQGWGDSIFTRVDEVLSYYNQTWNGIANLMADFAQGVLKVPGLMAQLSGKNKPGDGNPVTARARLIQQSRSVARMLVIDEKEDFQRLVASLSGVSDVLQQMALRMAAAADMPATLLMGQSPAGMSATGESDIRFFYDRIAAEQERTLAPQLRRLIKIVMLAKDGPTKGKEPEKWSAMFRPLYQMSDIEKADVRLKIAQSDKLYVDMQALSPEEIAASAFGGSEFSMDRMLDLEKRDAMALAEEEQKLAQAEALANGEMPPPDPNQPPGQPPGIPPKPGKPPPFGQEPPAENPFKGA